MNIWKCRGCLMAVQRDSPRTRARCEQQGAPRHPQQKNPQQKNHPPPPPAPAHLQQQLKTKKRSCRHSGGVCSRAAILLPQASDYPGGQQQRCLPVHVPGRPEVHSAPPAEEQYYEPRHAQASHFCERSSYGPSLRDMLCASGPSVGRATRS